MKRQEISEQQWNRIKTLFPSGKKPQGGRRGRLYSANTMRDYLERQAALSGSAQPVLPVSATPVDDPKYHVTTQKRPLSAEGG